MHWLDGIARVKLWWMGWPGLIFRDSGIGGGAFAEMAEARIWTRMLRRTIVRVNHVAGGAAAAAIISGFIVRAGQRKQRIEQSRFLQAEKNGIRAQQSAEAALAELVVRAAGFFFAIGLPISPFFSPPRSNTRRMFPGCEISQRSSGVSSGTTPFVRVSSAVGAGTVSSACGWPSAE